ncbi:unnamed protein product, partial [Amoebophrya sp. A120]|eukprot:GSA120T00013185001.1
MANIRKLSEEDCKKFFHNPGVSNVSRVTMKGENLAPHLPADPLEKTPPFANKPHASIRFNQEPFCLPEELNSVKKLIEEENNYYHEPTVEERLEEELLKQQVPENQQFAESANIRETISPSISPKNGRRKQKLYSRDL